MKTRKHLKTGRPARALGFALLASLLLTGAVTAEARPITLRATLILASDRGAPLDRRLEHVEYKLRRIFGFEYYKHYGEASAVINVPGSVTLSLGHGYRLLVHLTDGGKGRVRAHVKWLGHDQVLLSTAVNMKKNTPAILGGPSHEGGTLIMTLVAE